MKLAIYGAGGLGREVLILAQLINTYQSRWNEIFFIDDFNPGRELKGIAVRDFESISTTRDVEVVIAVGEPSARESLADKVKSSGLTLATLIHPNVYLSNCTVVGKGCVLCHGVYVSCDVIIRDNAFLQPYASVGHDCVIGEHAVLSTFVTLAGHCTIGARTFVGMSSVVKENTSIGYDTIVGMGAVVFNEVESGVVALGNPARVMRKNDRGRVFK
ncbi:NeuD/PglB/VioB family sugar acetyltransferase [Pectobacterium brasiliense]|uniref:NeuD/PglB/VioB family sugar acetyltransferase n=1 Tax=Pectobacterium brasiliense TaxID=180957 RepID=UPI001969217E|nr:NeuD/PglB/VioB family sugar acetyltransferase [Pectobacterium brasiliense]MBN3264075.1 NeuD/PglB/VioB family sugar acetyltransferase [Pectobacterium brasiliense]